ncbi:MAG TPA: hypothetical protein VFL95_09910 [Gemmatimonadales bacterium]|nr:hypothetical protein [Gemmatimonadales bacterium]
MTRLLATLTLCVVVAAPLAAQDTTQGEKGVRVGIDVNRGVRPGVIVLPVASGLDSVRAIVQRDLDYSDRFEMIGATDIASGTPTGGRATEGELQSGINYGLYRSFGASYGVQIVSAPGGVTVRLHDIRAGKVRNQQNFVLASGEGEAFRMSVHQVGDEVTRWISGTPGIAATQVLFVGGDKRIYRIDSDGWGATPITPAGEPAFSPAWSPDGRRFAYTRLDRGEIIVRDLGGGGAVTVPGTESGVNYTAAFSPDGRHVAFAHSDEQGTNIVSADVAARCCVQRLTVGRFADNLSPTYSPDGRRIAFVSTRAGPPQVYFMDADGADQQLLVPFDYGTTGASYSPEWAPDGTSVAFHRDVGGTFQVLVMDVASRRVRQVTSSGRNEDPTWAPDGRHLAFISDRTGRRQLWVLDLETGRVRQLGTSSVARIPSWSRRLGGAVSNP